MAVGQSRINGITLVLVCTLYASSCALGAVAEASTTSTKELQRRDAAVVPPLPKLGDGVEAYAMFQWGPTAAATLRADDPAAGRGDSLPPFQWDGRNILALAVSFLVAALAASAGVGGGVFFTPLAIVCLSFSA